MEMKMKSKKVLLFITCVNQLIVNQCVGLLALSSFITDPQLQHLAAAYQSVHRLNSLNVALSKYL